MEDSPSSMQNSVGGSKNFIFPKNFSDVTFRECVLLFVFLCLGGLVLIFPHGLIKKPINKETNSFADMPVTDIPSGMKAYTDEKEGVSFIYPENYQLVSDIRYPIFHALLVSGPDCSNTDRIKNFDGIGNCIVISAWETVGEYRPSGTGGVYVTTEAVPHAEKGSILRIDTEYKNAEATFVFPRYATSSDEVVGNFFVRVVFDRDQLAKVRPLLDAIKNHISVDRQFRGLPAVTCCTEPLPKIIFASSDLLYQFKNNKLTEIDIPDPDLIGGYVYNEASKKLAFWHLNYDRDGGHMWSSAKTGVYLADLGSDPVTIASLIPAGTEDSHTDFSFSPNGKYLSFVMNDGEGIGVMNLETKQIFSRRAGEAPNSDTRSFGAIAWLDDQTYSYIMDDGVYLEKVDSPQIRIMTAQGAVPSLPAFESAPTVVAPFWSADKKFVAYYGKNSFHIYDVDNDKTYSFGEPVQGEMYEYVNVNPVGWEGKTFVYASDNFQLKKAYINNGKLVTYVATNNSVKGDRVGEYIVDMNHDFDSPLIIFKPDRGVCTNFKHSIGSYIGAAASSHDEHLYVLAHPEFPETAQWIDHNSYYRLRDSNNSLVEVYDYGTCSALGTIKLDDGTANTHIDSTYFIF